MATSYDKVWETFLIKCKMDNDNVPSTNDAIHQTIQEAILNFNNQVEEQVNGDDTTEMLSRKLSDNELYLLSHMIRLVILENELIYQSTTYTPFTKELGVRNVGNQMSRLEKLVENQNNKIHSILISMQDDFL